MCTAFWESGGLALSGGMDGKIWLWSMPEDPANTNQCIGGDMFHAGCYDNHTDAVWDIQVHPKDDFLISASADGTVKLWKLGNPQSFKRNFVFTNGKEKEHTVPTSVAWINTAPDQFAATYVSGQVTFFQFQNNHILINI